jgi:hypothetical protein
MAHPTDRPKPISDGRLVLVASFFQKLFGKRRNDGVACFLRENGPIAYELDLFGESPRGRVDAMMSSGLSWAWKGSARDWTELTRISLSAFLADLASGNVILLATEGEPPVDLSDLTVKEWIRQFCRLQPSPLAAVITTADNRQLLFVQQHATDAVNVLLDEWGIDKGAAMRKAYPRLGPASLESVGDKL